MMLSWRIEAEELARVLSNALAFFPERSIVKRARIKIGYDCLEATATDTYTIARDECPAETLASQETPAPGRNGVSSGAISGHRNSLPCFLEVNREGLRALEEQARKDRGNWGRLDWIPGDCLTYVPTGDKANLVSAQDVTNTPWDMTVEGLAGEKFWNMCDDLLTRLDAGEVRAFDPQYLGRFGKVKTSKSVEADTILDLLWQGQAEPMLAKVGPSFVGAIMPIDRDVYVSNQPEGQEALW